MIDADGRIAAVGPQASVPSPPGTAVIQLDDAVLLPGLVNAHTHLELTGFAANADGLEFDRWILGLRRLKLARTSDEYRRAARTGLRECWAGGVTTIAETGDSGATLEALAELGGRGIVYHEVFGPHPDQLEERFAGLTRRLEELGRFRSERVRLGVSPHAPYTVSGPLFGAVARLAARERLPLAVHVAESPAETAFVARDAGPFAEAWRARGIPPLPDARQQPAGRSGAPRSPLAWLEAHGVLAAETLCIHAVQLGREDIALLAERGAAVAHCPGSNAAHRHGAAPLAELLRAGVRVGLGTDSVASVGALDLLREARLAAAQAGLAPGQALELATLAGARALGLGREIGSLTPGKWGDLIAVRAPRAADAETTLLEVLSTGPADVMLTVLAGRVVHRSSVA